jgi:hypothetical protein
MIHCCMTLLDSLVLHLKGAFVGLPDTRKGRTGNIAMSDIGMSAFALFFMQSESFLSFQRRLEDGKRRSNCQTLFGIERIPSDNYIRQHLDGADPALLKPCFTRVEAMLSDRSMREKFTCLGGRTLIAVDGTEYFCSQKLNCPKCSTRKRSNGAVESYHVMLSAVVVAPGHENVVPLYPEFIEPQDGAEKQDCERNAFKRWHAAHADRLRPNRPVYLGDDLYACQPTVAMLRAAGDDFIFTAKPTSHKVLYDFMAGAETETKVVRRGKKSVRYRWFVDAPISGGKDAELVNWACMETLDETGKVTSTKAFVTSLPVDRDSVAEVVSAGRARWKIENETFNVLKNNGYELEHNFGHGTEFLAAMLVALNLLAFAWHNALDVLGPTWREARDVVGKRTTFFQEMLTLTRFVVFPSWTVLLDTLVTSDIPPELLQPPPNTDAAG